MRKKHSIDSINTCLSIFISTFFISLAIPALASAPIPLVKIAKVKAWQQGDISIINCEVSVPFLTAFSSESDAKLTYLLPKGSQVKEGELIAEQQNYYYLKQLSRLEQALAVSTAEFTFNSKEFNRLSSLDNMISATTLESNLLKREQSKRKQQQVISEIDELEHRINRLRFFAPKSGTVVSTYSEPGEYLTQGTKVLSFLSNNEKEINCKVPVGKFSANKQAVFSLLNDNKERLNVKRINQVVDNTSQFVNVYLNAHNTEIPQLLGQRLKVKMSRANVNLTRLPVDGLNLAKSGDYVWQVNGNSKVSKVYVKLISNQSGYFLVESSLKVGDRVIILGKAGLTINQQVDVSSTKKVS
jgi:RND family efflux transporter MFP subunit